MKRNLAVFVVVYVGRGRKTEIELTWKHGQCKLVEGFFALKTRKFIRYKGK